MFTSLGAMRGLPPEKCVNLADKSLVVAPGEVRQLCDLEGPGRIVRIWFTTPLLGHRHVLRDVVCRIYWDGEAEPSLPAVAAFGGATTGLSLDQLGTVSGSGAHWDGGGRRHRSALVDRAGQVARESVTIR